MSNTTAPHAPERSRRRRLTKTDRLPVWRMGLTGGVVGTYLGLYALTTWLGTFA